MRLERAQILRRPRTEVFAFFADAANLQAITPPFLDFRILTPMPVRMAPGLLLDYRLKLFQVPFSWRTVIEAYDPPHSFTDVQSRGPYRLWRHTHRFEEVAEGTLMIDGIDYEMPFGLVGLAAHELFVRRTLDRIFDYRRTRIEELLSRAPAGSPRPGRPDPRSPRPRGSGCR